MLKKLAPVVCLIMASPCFADGLQNEWWFKQSTPQSGTSPKSSPPKPSSSPASLPATTSNDEPVFKESAVGGIDFTNKGVATSKPLSPFAEDTSAPANDRGVQEGNFVVPGYFSSQPKPYERPQEFQNQFSAYGPTGNGASPFAAYTGTGFGTGFGGFGTGLGWGGLSPFGFGGPWGGYGWGGGWGGPLGYGGFRPGFGGWGGPGFGGWGMPGVGIGIGGIGLGMGGYGPGIGFGGWGPGFGGFGPGFGGWGPGFGGLGFGGLGGGFGGNFGGAPNGVLTAPRFTQSAPSKPSGNYYEPSNIDTTASGSFYATGAPALTPVMKTDTAPKDYWGAGGNPFSGQMK